MTRRQSPPPALIDRSTDKVDSQRLGYALRRYRDRVVGGHRFVKADDDSCKVGLWTVEEI